MGTEKSKKSKVLVEEEDTDDVGKELDLSIGKLQEVQDELDKVNDEASEKILEVEQRYNEIRRPVYAKRNEIIKSIPDFWLTAFLSHPSLSYLLNDEDHKIFKYFDSLHVDDFKDVSAGYSVMFNFKENPYFHDTKLTKTFTFLDGGTANITGTAIKWKDGMGPANGADNKEKRDKRIFPDESFFTWFGDAEQKAAADGFQDEVAEIIKEDLWPNPLKYFHNEADEEDDSADDEGEKQHEVEDVVVVEGEED